MNRCYNCKFWATQDSGYSNYTVMETTVHCIKNHFSPMDESYSWGKADPEQDAEILKLAESCPDFKNSERQIRLDVDGYSTIEDYKDDPELYEAANAYEGF